MEQLTHTDKEVIVVNGPPQIPLSFPRDSFGHHFLENTFHETLPNGEKVSQDWWWRHCSWKVCQVPGNLCSFMFALSGLKNS